MTKAEFTHRICTKGYDIFISDTEPKLYSIRYGNRELAVAETETQALKLVDLFSIEGRKSKNDPGG